MRGSKIGPSDVQARDKYVLRLSFFSIEVGKEGLIDSTRLRELLTEVDLEYLIEREGGVDSIVDWGAQLSLGEQQRLGMARLFYHTPKFAILDECTSGVTVSRFLPSSSHHAIF